MVSVMQGKLQSELANITCCDILELKYNKL